MGTRRVLPRRSTSLAGFNPWGSMPDRCHECIYSKPRALGGRVAFLVDGRRVWGCSGLPILICPIAIKEELQEEDPKNNDDDIALRKAAHMAESSHCRLGLGF